MRNEFAELARLWRIRNVLLAAILGRRRADAEMKKALQLAEVEVSPAPPEPIGSAKETACRCGYGIDAHCPVHDDPGDEARIDAAWAKHAAAKPTDPLPSAPVETQEGRADERIAKYHELLYAVARKHPGESRHETALRYIRERENQAVGGPSAAPPEARTLASNCDDCLRDVPSTDKNSRCPECAAEAGKGGE